MIKIQTRKLTLSSRTLRKFQPQLSFLFFKILAEMVPPTIFSENLEKIRNESRTGRLADFSKFCTPALIFHFFKILAEIPDVPPTNFDENLEKIWKESRSGRLAEFSKFCTPALIFDFLRFWLKFQRLAGWLAGWPSGCRLGWQGNRRVTAG